MPSNEQLPLPPQQPIPERTQHVEDYSPLGQSAVMAHEIGQNLANQIAWHESAVEFADSMGYRMVPEPSTFHVREIQYDGPVVAKKSAHSAPEPVEPVGYQLPYVADVHRSAAEAKRVTQVLVNESLTKNLDSVRARLTEISPVSRPKLDAYLDADMPADLKTARAAWQKQSGNPDGVAWLKSMSNDQLVQFLEWHNNRLDGINADPAVQEKIAQQKAAYKNKIQKAVESGQLPIDAEEIAVRVDQIEPIIGDTFDTVMKGNHGYRRSYDGRVVVEENYSTRTFDHEMSHAVLGSLPNTHLEEGMTELATLALESGDFSTADPERFPDDDIYLGNRYLIHALAVEGTTNLLPVLWKEYCAGRTGTSDTQGFHGEVAASFGGVDVMKLLPRLIDETIEDLEITMSDAHPKTRTQYALMYATRSITMIGGVVKGKTDEEILGTWAGFADVADAPEALRKELEHTFLVRAGIVDQLAQIRSGMASGRSKVA